MPKRILAIGVISLLVLATVPVLLLVIALVAFQRQSHTFWLGLGCTVVTFESSAAMVCLMISKISYFSFDRFSGFQYNILRCSGLQARNPQRV